MSKNTTLNQKLFSPDVELIPTRNGYGDGLLELGKANPAVVVLTGDLAESTRVLPFSKAYPDRFIECGVAEQNMAGIAAGLALSGKIPFISSYAVFSPGRSWDQVRVSICINRANVKIAGAHTGVSVGPDGATHQALEDIAIMRTLPNMTVIAPCDYEETRKATRAAAAISGPVYFRFGREKTPVITTPKTPFAIGRAEVFQGGSDVTIFACGPLLYEALITARDLTKAGVSCEVINNHTIKPLDVKTILASVKKTRCAVTVEEHQIMGGMEVRSASSSADVFLFPLKWSACTTHSASRERPHSF